MWGVLVSFVFLYTASGLNPAGLLWSVNEWSGKKRQEKGGGVQVSPLKRDENQESLPLAHPISVAITLGVKAQRDRGRAGQGGWLGVTDLRSGLGRGRVGLKRGGRGGRRRESPSDASEEGRKPRIPALGSPGLSGDHLRGEGTEKPRKGWTGGMIGGL